jgi:hypothetical protein
MPILRPAHVAALLISLCSAVAAKGAIVSGTVTSPNGTRLGGKIVEAYDASGVSRATATTTANGTYILAAAQGEYRLLAYDPQGLYATSFYGQRESFESITLLPVFDGAPPRQADFVLPLGATVTGSVTSASGPLTNAVVEVYNLSGTRRGFTHTDAEGNYSLVVPVGDYKVFAYDANDVFAGEFSLNARAFAEAAIVSATPGAPRTVSFALDRASHVSGGVFDAGTHRGIAGMQVDVYTADGLPVATKITDSLGLFRFTLQGGQYRFVAGDPMRNYGPSFWQSGRSFATTDVVTVTSGVDRLNVALVAERAAYILGRVSNFQTIVTAYNLDGTVHTQAPVDGSGLYSLALAPGQYKVAAVPLTQYATQFYGNAPGFDTAQVITLLAGQTLRNIDFDPPPAGRFTGTVRDAVTQQPLAGMTVAAYDTAGVRAAETTTNAAGTYTLFAAPGQYRLVAFDARFDYATSYAPAPLAVSVDAPVPLDFALRHGTRVSGTVSLANGGGVDGAEVLAFDLAGNPVGGATTKDGAFTLVVLPGIYTFIARTQFTSDTIGPMPIGTAPPAPLAFTLEGSGRRRALHH